MNCEYMRHVIGQEMDAGFDGGEFSSHEEEINKLTPCGNCEACRERLPEKKEKKRSESWMKRKMIRDAIKEASKNGDYDLVDKLCKILG